MAEPRKPKVDTIPKGQLLTMVKKELDACDIPYKEEPGGFGDALILRPEDTVEREDR